MRTDSGAGFFIRDNWCWWLFNKNFIDEKLEMMVTRNESATSTVLWYSNNTKSKQLIATRDEVITDTKIKLEVI